MNGIILSIGSDRARVVNVDDRFVGVLIDRVRFINAVGCRVAFQIAADP